MTTTWTVALLGTAVVLATVVPGVYLWWPVRRNETSRSSLGQALMTGTVISIAMFAIQIMFDARLTRLDHQRQAAQEARNVLLERQAERQRLSLVVGMQHDLQGVDFRGRDLSGFFLARKRLIEAQFADARLDDAYLAEANLAKADFRDAKLPRANLDDSNLYYAILAGADLRGASLRGADMRDADLSQADLRGADLTSAVLTGTALGAARYDAATLWPSTLTVPACAPAHVCAYDV